MRFKILLLIPISLFALPGYHEPWGKDSDLILKAKEKEPELSILGWSADQAIRFHHNVLTKADGPRSHFRPTSSRYMQLAIQRYGFIQGVIMGCDRLMRENDEKWVYKTVMIDGKTYKWDPALKSGD